MSSNEDRPYARDGSGRDGWAVEGGLDMGTTKRISLAVQVLLVALILSGLSLGGVAFIASTPFPWGGIALAQTSGICDRTQEVRDAILAELSDVSDCANVDSLVKSLCRSN